MAKLGKQRLDLVIVNKGLVQSRERAKAMIMSGRVLVNRLPVDKPGTQVAEDAEITLKGKDIPFASRGGLKLEKALIDLPLNVTGFTCLDIGASTGGFTDCLLQHGVQRVYAVDVGYGQLAWQLRQNSKVVVMERTNIRHMPREAIQEPLDLVTVDTSFISLTLVLPAAEKFMTNGTRILALIKPQFEAGKERLGKGGVVRDPDVRAEIVREIELFFKERGYELGPVIPSPVPGPKGNVEFIISMKYFTVSH